MDKNLVKMLVLSAVCLFIMVGAFVTCSYSVSKSIEKAGGMRNILVETGKEVKSISDEINDK